MSRSLSERHPLSWLFHRNSSRWPFNSVSADEGGIPQPGRETATLPFVALPSPLELSMTLGTALAARKSCRSFATIALDLEAVATMLHASYGITGTRDLGAMELLERATPSGGGLYPLELTLLVREINGMAPGIYHYVPALNGLEEVREVLVPRALQQYLFMGQAWAADAALVVVFSAAFERSMSKYGDRGYRYLLIEAGHAAQSLNLAAAALGICSCNLGGFFDVELARLLSLEVEVELPIYSVALGFPEPGEVGPVEHSA